MGIMDALAGGLSEAAGGAAKIGFDMIQSQIDQDREAALIQMRTEAQKGLMQTGEDIRRGGRQADFEQDQTNAPAKMKTMADQETAVGTARAGVEREAAKNKAQDTLQFQTDNQKQITSNERASALAKHIVDPAYTMVPNADGTVTMVNTRNPNAGAVTLKGEDGKPIIRKDPEELKAATAILNDANKTLSIAEAKFKADSMNPEAQAEWKAAQQQHARDTAASRAVILGKAGADSSKEPAQPRQINAGQVVDGYTFKGGDPKNKANWEKAKESTSRNGADQSSGAAPRQNQTFNEADYESVDSTIAGARRGDQKAKQFLRSMLDEGGLTIGQRAAVAEAIK